MSSDDLQRACKTGDLETVRRLVQEEGLDVNSLFDLDEKTALHIAAQFGHSEVVQYLLENHADAHARSRVGWTPLHSACIRYGNLQIVQLLIDHKADTTSSDNFGTTALHCACRCVNSSVQLVQLLIDNKADVTATTQNGLTPLHLAVQENADIGVVRCLIDSKAGVINAPDKLGKTVLHRNIGRTFGSASAMELLLSRNADVFARDNNLMIPLHYWIISDGIEAVGMLFDHLRETKGTDTIESLLLCANKCARGLPVHYVTSAEMAKLLLEQPLSKNDQLVPQVSRDMLFAKDAEGKSLLESSPWHFSGEVQKYLSSYTDLPLMVPAAPTCQHLDKKQRGSDMAARLHPTLNEFQRTIGESFRNKWNGWSTLFPHDATDVEGEGERTYHLLPDELKYPIMAYLSLADIMRIKTTD